MANQNKLKFGLSFPLHYLMQMISFYILIHRAYGIKEQNPEMSIWTQGVRIGIGQVFTMKSFVVCNVHLI